MSAFYFKDKLQVLSFSYLIHKALTLINFVILSSRFSCIFRNDDKEYMKDKKCSKYYKLACLELSFVILNKKLILIPPQYFFYVFALLYHYRLIDHFDREFLNIIEFFYNSNKLHEILIIEGPFAFSLLINPNAGMIFLT